MELMSQPFSGQLGDRLIELLCSADYHTLNIAVAFAKNSGVLRIKDLLAQFRGRGGTVNVHVGVDLGGTSYEALTALLLHTDLLNVVHSERSQTFHSKIYQFTGENNGLLVVGSHNLTGGGLWTNFESSVHIPIDGEGAGEAKILKEVGVYFNELAALEASFMPITSQDEVDRLLSEGYVDKEVADRVRRASAAKKDGSKKRLFGTGTPAKLPRLTPVEEELPTPADPTPTETAAIEVEDLDQTIWFETRAMTGGSRNILDLSKRSLIESGDPSGTPFDLGEANFMRGGVEFFGLSPTATDQIANITINFEGKDYFGNTILYPEGSNANGTWRLQIKGVNSSDQKITDAFRDEGETHYLVRKVITFTKVQDDYFYMSVFPELHLRNSKRLQKFWQEMAVAGMPSFWVCFRSGTAILGVCPSERH
ncbi:phospholipase D family protein [Phaeobacter sp. J2-8]|uniref:phospholipase D family protein n=1 Tax=Phaeobacter sp. J2-8 TaxID=2931394 RepID=UPI001FD37218|nr:phospholipase D family protein [Phaeobacter sp. J2-8]MCJ7871523.1 phospholipase D family protein [Phaeobacter sp. J2-8]